MEQSVILRLHENYKRAKADFQLTIETILRYLEYNMSFKTLFIFCESAPYTFYDELLKKDNSVKTIKKVNHRWIKEVFEQSLFLHVEVLETA